MTTTPPCPLCGNPLSPILKGSYAHFPDSRFCDKCVRFIELTPEEIKEHSK